jgi:hypothetical protein
MLKASILVGTLASATAAVTSEVLGLRRLRGGSGNQNNGAVDVSICRWQNQHPPTGVATPANYIYRHQGTLHDDETDQQVDCTAPGSCNSAQAHGNGYGDNIDCHATISAPPNAHLRLQFSQINLESGAACGSLHGGVGCDVVTIYDGPDETSPVLGVYSGTTRPAPIQSTGNVVTVRFETDAGNAAIHNSQDPGFYLDWQITESVIARGDGICPAEAIYTTPHGIIHDQLGDVNCNAVAGGCDHAGGGAANGYNDRTDCYTTIRAPVGSQVHWTFTQLNLELTGCSTGAPGGGCPAGGCDYVKIYDGATSTSTLLGQFSGFQTGANLPSVISTGRIMRIEFHTDVGNCGITNGQDPGFQGSWNFISNGQNICQPDSSVLTAHHGVLHDDDITTGGSYADGAAHTPGYGDNLDCGVRIRAPAGATVNLHIVQMNLEGDGNGICDPSSPHYIGHSCDANGGDFLKIYDGRDNSSTLLAALNGQPTDAVRQQDSFTSTGRDLYVKFETDTGNYGLTGTTASPGFYAEWEIITNGRSCTAFTETPGQGLIGHNNEALSGVGTGARGVARCTTACCARRWCKSFDFIESLNGGTCNLADVSYTEDQGIMGANQFNNYYERPLASLPPALPPLGAAGCQARLASISSVVSWAFPSCTRSILTEIYICHACSCQEIEDGNAARAGDERVLRCGRLPHLAAPRVLGAVRRELDAILEAVLGLAGPARHGGAPRGGLHQLRARGVRPLPPGLHPWPLRGQRPPSLPIAGAGCLLPPRARARLRPMPRGGQRPERLGSVPAGRPHHAPAGVHHPLPRVLRGGLFRVPPALQRRPRDSGRHTAPVPLPVPRSGLTHLLHSAGPWQRRRRKPPAQPGGDGGGGRAGADRPGGLEGRGPHGIPGGDGGHQSAGQGSAGRPQADLGGDAGVSSGHTEGCYICHCSLQKSRCLVRS